MMTDVGQRDNAIGNISAILRLNAVRAVYFTTRRSLGILMNQRPGLSPVFSSLNAKRREFYCRAAIKCQRNSQGNFLYSNIRSSYYQSVLALVDGHANNSIRRVIICKTGNRYRREACASHYVDFTIQNDSYLYELSYCS